MRVVGRNEHAFSELNGEVECNEEEERGEERRKGWFVTLPFPPLLFISFSTQLESPSK